MKFTDRVKNLNGEGVSKDDVVLLDRFEQNEQFLSQGSFDDPLPFPSNYAKRYPF